MSGMNEYLAAHYGTAVSTSPSTTSEDVEKQAQVQLFAKLAADNNIDLNNLPDDKIADLWNEFQKVAEFPPKKDDGDKDDEGKKKNEAKEEHEEKKAAAEKLAEADFLGRTMAHAYVDELKKIAADTTAAAATSTPAATTTKEAGGMPPWLKKGVEGAKAEGDKGKDKKEGKKEEKKEEKAPPSKSKKASALDELACSSALKKVAEAGFDVDEAGTRLGAVLQLPIADNTKIAQVADLDTAIEVRSLELLEMAGYPVTWNQ